MTHRSILKRGIWGTLFFARPFLKIASAFDRLIYLVNRYRTYARLQAMFPGRVVHCDVTTEFKYPENISCGDHILIGPYASLGAMASITLEDHVRLSRGVVLETASLDIKGALPYRHEAKPIYLSKGVWVGTKAIILGGVTIGEQAVIAAGAIVTRDIPAHAIAAGIPAKVIGQRATLEDNA